MQKRKALLLSPSGVIAASIAATFSGQALAEQAGRVSFAIGDVSATAADGQTRLLRRGDALNGGDRIDTHNGRLQIRFTDGGFVSLQPHSVFGIDQYLYANKPPEETSLFFSLLSGGMRTITGAIGKVSKQNYKVRTPVATIGIRGTAYVAQIDPDTHDLIVNVGSGYVDISNGQGSVVGGPGQNIQVHDSGAPALTYNGVGPTAAGPEDATTTTTHPTVATGNQVDTNGIAQLLDNGIVGSTRLPDGAGYSILDGSGSYINSPQSGITASFNADGSLNTLTTMTCEISPCTYQPGTLQSVNVGTKNGISWGELTNGTAITDTSAPPVNLTSSAGPNQFISYVIGKDVRPAFSGSATYNLSGGTAPRLDGSTPGTLNIFILTLDLDSATAAVNLQVGMNGETITATGTNLSPYANGNNFNLYNIATTSTGSFCGSCGCSTSISGFFSGQSGEEIGAAYNITGNSYSSHITGTAALTSTDAVTKLTTGTGYALLADSGSGFVADNPNNGSNVAAVFDSAGNLTSATVPPPLTVVAPPRVDLNKGTTTLVDSGTFKTLSWGRLTGAGTTATFNGSPITLTAADNIHYLVGQAMLASDWTTLNTNLATTTATYSLVGGTKPTDLAGNVGTLDSAIMSVNFGASPTLNVNLQATISNTVFNVTGSGAAGPTFSLSNLATTANGSACGGCGCSTAIDGFLSGPQAVQAGLSYHILDQRAAPTIITGVAALARQTVNAP